MNHERDTIAAFIVSAKRRRYLEFVSQPRYRKKLIRELPHFKDFEPKFKRSIPSPRQSPVPLAELLAAKGAPRFCWVISEDSRIDARQIPLIEALEEVVGLRMGTIVSCVPGRLAFVETEDERFILERTDYRPQRSTLVRFFATERDSDSHVEEGIFQAAYTLLYSDNIDYYEWRRLRSLLDWFNDHLGAACFFFAQHAKKRHLLVQAGSQWVHYTCLGNGSHSGRARDRDHESHNRQARLCGV